MGYTRSGCSSRTVYWVIGSVLLFLHVPLLAAKERRDDDLDSSFLRPVTAPPPKPSYKDEGPPQGFDLPPVPAEQSPNLSQIADLYVKRIVFEGCTVFAPEELAKLAAPHEGRLNSVAELEDLRQELTRLYVGNGYINSGAVIPKGGLVDGVLTFRMVEGKLTEIRVRGLERLREAYVSGRLEGDKDEPLNRPELQNRFQQLLSDPLIGRMNARLLPGSAPGQSVLDLDVVRARPYHLSISGDNYRPPRIGAEGFGLSGWVRNLTGFGDMLDFSYATSYASEMYSGGFSVPFTARGSEAFVRFYEGESYVYDSLFQALGAPTSRVHSLEGGISHPVINRVDMRLNLGLSLAVRENETSLGDLPFSFIESQNLFDGRNQATVWRLSQEYLQRFARQAVSFRSTFNVGMNALGATKETNKKYADGEYFSWLGQAYYTYQAMDNGAQLVMRGNLQFSNDHLLPLEQFSIGGVYSVRGYRENTLVRDEGYNFTLEFQYPILGEGINAPNRLVLIPFVDYGRAWNHGAANNIVFSNRPYEEMYSAGVGVNWALKPLSADFYWGHAFKPAPTRSYDDLQDDGIHFQVRLDIL